MPELLTKLSFQGKVEMLLASPDRDAGLEKHKVAEARFLFTGMEGDCHGGITRKSDVRMVKQYKRDTEVRNSASCRSSRRRNSPRWRRPWASRR